jgi:thiol:disulfide interchange protein
MKKVLKYLLICLFSLNNNYTAAQDQKSQEFLNLFLELEVSPGQIIYADSLNISIDSFDFQISDLQINKKPQIIKDSNQQEIAVFNQSFQINCKVEKIQENQPEPNLQVSYFANPPKEIIQKSYPIYSLARNYNYQIEPNQVVNQETNQNNNKNKITLEPNQNLKASLWLKVANFSKYLQNALRTSDSISLRLILVFFLGLLMSLTPCIYPMIPITAGILQAQGSSSLGRSFVLAFTYTLGTSTTFACFGLIAALTGHLFGQLLVNPIFIILIVALLGYLGLSMFGLYDMYVPKFMEQNNSFNQKQSSLFSIFIFGAISGSMASPCLSPGLALLLSIVATLGNHALGFLMLFIFGLGLSVPLLIIGTFSNSINMIPQSGTWMVEIKKIFGFMLLGMCIYLLSNILPINIIYWLTNAFVFGSGVYYLQNISKFDDQAWYYLKQILGVILIALSVLLSWQTVQNQYFKQLNLNNESQANNWLTDYEAALKIGYAQNKKLLIDCGADWCSICKAIDRKIFGNPSVQQALTNFVLLKVNATDQNSEPYATLKNKYQILGVPTILIINPNNHELIKRWGSDLYDLSHADFIEQLNN